MTKKLSALLLFIFLLTLTSSANAQTATSEPQLKEAIMNIREQKQAVTSQIKKEVKKEARIELREQIKETVAAKREETREKMETKREEFKAKLQAIKDEKKKILVERIDAKLSAMNTKHTDNFAEILGKLQTLLDKAKENTSAEITSAQAAIDAAKTAVENQAAKTYTITITNEEKLRLNVGTTTSQLRQDLMAVHKLIVNAKQEIQKLRKEKMQTEKEATNSADL